MITANSPAATAFARRGSTGRVIFNRPSSTSSTRRVVVRFRDGDDNQTQAGTTPSTKLSPEQLDEVKRNDDISPHRANLKADLGTAYKEWGPAAVQELQSFDGPGPETINSRLAMLGVVIGLAGEWFTGLGLMEQTADHPITVFLSFVLISIATYVPISKGYTRKEAFSNKFLGLNWTPQAENWNGRLAMMGFLGMVFTEWIAGVNTLQAWGLQPQNWML